MAIKYTDEERNRIEQYILINHEYETTSDLTRSLGIPRTQVAKFCEQLNITPVTATGLILHYAAGPGRWQSIREMAKSLDMDAGYLGQILKANGIVHEKQLRPGTREECFDLSKEPSPKFETLSPQYRDGYCRLFLALNLKLVQVGWRHYRFVPNEKEIKRPPAEYDVMPVSETVKQVYATRGIKTKL